MESKGRETYSLSSVWYNFTNMLKAFYEWGSVEMHSLLQKKAHGSELFDKVCYHLDIVETDYFGIQYLDQANVRVSNCELRNCIAALKRIKSDQF